MQINFEEYGRIISAALLYNNCIYMSKLGHYAIFQMEPIGVLRNAKQGFVTENGYFVDRKIGLYIADYYNQISDNNNQIGELYSEFLKKEDKKVLKHIKKYTYKENND